MLDEDLFERGVTLMGQVLGEETARVRANATRRLSPRGTPNVTTTRPKWLGASCSTDRNSRCAIERS